LAPEVGHPDVEGAILRSVLIVACGILALPVLTILLSWLAFDTQAQAILQHQWSTVLPDYALQSLLLVIGVGVGTALLGVGSAVAVSLFDFKGRRSFEWALLLPLAMPAYVMAYAYTDALQFSGPLQVGLRKAFGWEGALWPDVRSLWGAVVLFVLCLYPYVYLLTKAALGERAVQLMEAARLLGADLERRLLTVALPLARPAVMAGVALALMETLADYGVGSYFGLSTFTTGIYRAWLSMGDPHAAAQLASVLLLVVGLLLTLERHAQAKLRFGGSRSGNPLANDARPVRLTGVAAAMAWLLCAIPVVAGFVLPAGWLAAMLWRESTLGEVGLPWQRFGEWAWASFRLAGLTAVLATGLALALGFALRRQSTGLDRVLKAASRILALGYAVPGAVVAIGILLPLGWIQARWPELGLTPLLTGTVTGVVLAYLVRFSSVAQQALDAGYARVAPSVDETARMLGAGPIRTFWRLHVPLVRRSALAAALLVFVDTMKELPATLVLRPFGSDTLAVVAYNLARDERLAEASLPSLAIVAVGLIPVVMLARAIRH
jgi:iron(III) transport system permease protein